MITTDHKIHFQTGSRSKKKIALGLAEPTQDKGRIQRLSKIMALAIRFDTLIRDGIVKDQAELARLGYVSRARLTQIMMLLQLASDIQEEILFLPMLDGGYEPVREHELRRIAKEASWDRQREMWRAQKLSDAT